MGTDTWSSVSVLGLVAPSTASAYLLLLPKQLLKFAISDSFNTLKLAGFIKGVSGHQPLLLFIYVYVCICICMYTCVFSWRPEDAIGPPRVDVGDYERPNVGAGKGTMVFCKRDMDCLSTFSPKLAVWMKTHFNYITIYNSRSIGKNQTNNIYRNVNENNFVDTVPSFSVVLRSISI